MLGWIIGGVAALYGGGALYGFARRGLDGGPYPAPEAAEREMEALALRHPALIGREVIGQSTEGRALHAFRFRAGADDDARPRVLVTAHIHAVEYIGAYVARAVARRLADGYGHDPEVTALLDRADVWVAPLLNPDGAARIWRSGGWTRLGGARFTANGVDPNRNFPFVPLAGRAGWNSSSSRPGSPYYRGPHPLSEPECLAVARLAKRERFCGAINFHSFGCVVFLPQALGDDTYTAVRALGAFQGTFQSRQGAVRYRPIPERSATITGQLDPFLLNAFGTPSVTVEVSRPGAQVLMPANTFNVFWWANPRNPQRWADNDTAAAIHALAGLVDRTGGSPVVPAQPELAGAVS